MPASASKQAARSPADRAADGAAPWRPPRLPSEIWQQISRAALAAEDGDPRAWARLSAVNSLWRAAVSCAVLVPDSVPEAGPMPGDHQLLCIVMHSKHKSAMVHRSLHLINATKIEVDRGPATEFYRGALCKHLCRKINSIVGA